MHSAVCLEFCFILYSCPWVTFLLLAWSQSQIHARICLAATLVPGLGFQQVWCLPRLCLLPFFLHPRREPSKGPPGSGSSGNGLHRFRLQWKTGPKALSALWLPAGKLMDMRTAGVPSNDGGEGLLFPLPFPDIPDLLFQGRAVSRGNRAWLPGWVSISDARHQVAGVTRGCHRLKRLLPWMRNSTPGKVSPLQRSNTNGSGVEGSFAGPQLNSQR